ncbi:hypothetical protein SAMN05443637_105263 [Pseudonocardia thermophila]|uniref:Uncharacterized protein n=1 Tax=Pseudonocardia thermophila TaxID=1848 RepID=A0A1M6S0U7_PSETH|nr:hypothetical protein SAMN05443637_105263 [Pseudonocardia thermophila]
MLSPKSWLTRWDGLAPSRQPDRRCSCGAFTGGTSGPAPGRTAGESDDLKVAAHPVGPPDSRATSEAMTLPSGRRAPGSRPAPCPRGGSGRHPHVEPPLDRSWGEPHTPGPGDHRRPALTPRLRQRRDRRISQRPRASCDARATSTVGDAPAPTPSSSGQSPWSRRTPPPAPSPSAQESRPLALVRTTPPITRVRAAGAVADQAPPLRAVPPATTQLGVERVGISASSAPTRTEPSSGEMWLRTYPRYSVNMFGEPSNCPGYRPKRVIDGDVRPRVPVLRHR